MASSGTIVIQIYTSDARLPLQDASIAVTRHGAEGTELVAFRVSNYDGMTDRQTVQPLRLIPTPSLPESYTRTQIVDVTPQDL